MICVCVKSIMKVYDVYCKLISGYYIITSAFQKKIIIFFARKITKMVVNSSFLKNVCQNQL